MNHTTLGLVAIFAAATLVIGTLAAVAPAAFAWGHYKRHYKESIGDGNTLTAQKNQGKAIASGFGTTAANIQLNNICFVTATCLG
jgi:hypothetical protein